MSEGYNDYNQYENGNSQNNYGGQNNNGGQNSYRQPNAPKKKSGVGKIVAITLGMLLLVGVAAAGGYSAHTILDQIGNKEEVTTGASLDKETPESEAPKETLSHSATTSVQQGQTGTVILTDVSDVVDAVMPSIVSITNSGVYTSQGFGYWSQPTEIPTESSGSGIIIGQNDTELLIVTNNHVVADNTSLTVQFVDNSTAEAVIKGAKSTSDIAIIAVKMDDLSEETKSAITIANLGDSDSLRMGQGVIAIGNALGYGQSVTEGCVSALNREVTTNEGVTLTVLQTSAAINPGNSGGALLNASGEVIGINTAKVMNDEVEGIGYAIPISSVKDLIEEMMNYTTRSKVAEEDASYLGIQPVTVDSQSASAYGMPVGVYVYAVVDGSPAAGCGLKEKDIITAIDQYSLDSSSDLQETLSYYAGGDTATLTVQRQIDGSYQEMKLEVTFAYKRDFTNR